jgi:hypothetical protein
VTVYKVINGARLLFEAAQTAAEAEADAERIARETAEAEQGPPSGQALRLTHTLNIPFFFILSKRFSPVVSIANI